MESYSCRGDHHIPKKKKKCLKQPSFMIPWNCPVLFITSKVIIGGWLSFGLLVTDLCVYSFYTLHSSVCISFSLSFISASLESRPTYQFAPVFPYNGYHSKLTWFLGVHILCNRFPEVYERENGKFYSISRWIADEISFSIRSIIVLIALHVVQKLSVETSLRKDLLFISFLEIHGKY